MWKVDIKLKTDHAVSPFIIALSVMHLKNYIVLWLLLLEKALW